MFPVDLEVIAVNEDAVFQYGMEVADRNDDGVIGLIEVGTKEQLVKLVADKDIKVLIVFMDNKYKDSFSEFISFRPAPHAFGMDNEDNDMDKVLEIILKT